MPDQNTPAVRPHPGHDRIAKILESLAVVGSIVGPQFIRSDHGRALLDATTVGLITALQQVEQGQ